MAKQYIYLRWGPHLETIIMIVLIGHWSGKRHQSHYIREIDCLDKGGMWLGLTLAIWMAGDLIRLMKGVRAGWQGERGKGWLTYFEIEESEIWDLCYLCQHFCFIIWKSSGLIASGCLALSNCNKPLKQFQSILSGMLKAWGTLRLNHYELSSVSYTVGECCPIYILYPP